jgi:regulator of protease activity HflC (stomatin/prohibitin superfamily)
VWRLATDLAVVIRLPPELIAIYGLAIVIWYELLRLAVTSRIAKRRSSRAERDEFEQWRRQEGELAEQSRRVAEQEAAEEAEPDPARRYYYIARRTARAERDAAVETANKAVDQAIERIERRHLEIEAALDHEETERLKRQHGHPIEGT